MYATGMYVVKYATQIYIVKYATAMYGNVYGEIYWVFFQFISALTK